MEIKALQEYVFDFLAKQLPKQLYYHNLQHTKDVLAAALLLAEAENIPEEEKLILIIASLFHDTGFIATTVNHEQVSCEIARKILPAYHCSNRDIETVCKLIMATKTPQHPDSHVAAVLCDADLFYLGTDKFKEYGDNLYRELQALQLIDSYEVWNKRQVHFLSAHTYFTETARQKLNHNKLHNLRTVMTKTSL